MVGTPKAVESGRGVANHWGNIQFGYLGREKQCILISTYMYVVLHKVILSYFYALYIYV